MKHLRHQHLFTCLGEAINMRRKRLGISQDELAEESGIDRTFLSNVERGRRNPSFGTVASIADGLKMRYSRLVANCEKCKMQRDRLPEREHSANPGV